jgi:hypothetical protein
MSDFPPTTNSAINTATASSLNATKNKKKRDKKKAKKQESALGGLHSSTSEISSPALTDKENIDPSDATALPVTATAVPISTTNTADPTDLAANTAATTATEAEAETPSSGTHNISAARTAEPATAEPATTTNDPLVQNASTTASTLPAQPIQASAGNSIPAAGPVGVGAAGATAAGAAAAAAAVAASSKPSSIGTVPPTSGRIAQPTTTTGTASLLPEPLPLSESVQHTIKTAVASGYIDTVGIVETIRKNVAAGEYKEKAALPPKFAATTTTAPKAGISPQSNVAQPSTAQTAGATKVTPPAPIAKDSKKGTVKKAVTGAGAAVAGAGAAVAGAVKSSTGKSSTGKSATNTTAGNTATTSTATATKPTTTALGAETAKLSENVQHCIKSVVNAASVDVYGILDPSSKVKRPEAAVGGPAQPTMPSSAKAPDATQPQPPTKRNKPSEHRKSPLASLKKKNCIIL